MRYIRIAGFQLVIRPLNLVDTVCMPSRSLRGIDLISVWHATLYMFLYCARVGDLTRLQISPQEHYRSGLQSIENRPRGHVSIKKCSAYRCALAYWPSLLAQCDCRENYESPNCAIYL
jgi:hypothetical protein